MTDWRPPHRLEPCQDSESLVVVLHRSGTRMLRSWRHTGTESALCGNSGTAELSLGGIAREEEG